MGCTFRLFTNIASELAIYTISVSASAESLINSAPDFRLFDYWLSEQSDLPSTGGTYSQQIALRTRPKSAREVRERAFALAALLTVCTRAPTEAWVMARLTTPAHTHTHIHTLLWPTHLPRQPRTHPHSNPKLRGETHTPHVCTLCP